LSPGKLLRERMWTFLNYTGNYYEYWIYQELNMGFDYETCGVVTSINKQSPDIAMGVNKGGAGDQGLMFGFACDDTEEFYATTYNACP